MEAGALEWVEQSVAFRRQFNSFKWLREDTIRFTRRAAELEQEALVWEKRNNREAAEIYRRMARDWRHNLRRRNSSLQQQLDDLYAEVHTRSPAHACSAQKDPAAI
jgi:hypothetical protein